MGRIFMVDLEGRTYGCKFRKTHLALADGLVSGNLINTRSSPCKSSARKSPVKADTDVPTTTMDGSYDSKKLRLKDNKAETNDSSKLEMLREHQDLIQQLKLELGKVELRVYPLS